MKQYRIKTRSLKAEGGFTLIETAIALGILAVIGVIFLQALNTTSSSTNLYEQRVTAANLAQSQVEAIKAEPYQADYLVTVASPPGYSITVSTVELEVGKQEITVTVSKDSRPLFKLTIVKTDWA